MTTERDHIDRELKEEGSTLPELLRRDTMRVPDGYFEDLEGAILDQTVNRQSKRTRVIFMRRITIAAAAAVVILFIGIKLFRTEPVTSDLPLALAAMEEAELETYIQTQVDAISYEEIYTYLTNNVQSIEPADLFTSEFVDAGEVSTTMHEELHEQVFTEVSPDDETILEDRIMDDIDASTIQEFLNNEALFDDWAL